MDIITSTSKDYNVIELPKEGNAIMPTTPEMASNFNVIPRSMKTTLGFRNMHMEYNGYELPEYNLYDISQAEDVDGIIKRSIKIKRALASKEGWRLTGVNEKTIQFILERFNELGIVQKESMNLFFKNLVGDTIRFNNAYVREHKSSVVSNGILNGVRGKPVKKIVGYTLIAPETMRYKLNKAGHIIKYMQILPDGRHKEFSTKEIKHIRMNPRSGLNMAPPALLPAVDDIRALRRIEENVELLIEQHLFPLLVVSIGTDSHPATQLMTGEDEIDAYTQKLEAMPSSGSLVVSHRHSFDLLGSASVLDVTKYLEHFKKRAYTSVGVSNLDMGEGEGMNRATADNASKILIDDVKDYQKEVAEQIEMFIINPLLLEKYNSNVLALDHQVKFTWNEIDLESMIKLQNHNMLIFQANGIEHDELRDKLDRRPMTEEQLTKTNFELYTKNLVEVEGKLELNKAMQTKQQPTNQHKTNTGPTKKKSSIDHEVLYSIVNKIDAKNTDLILNQTLEYILSLDISMDVLYNITQVKDEVHSILSDINEQTDSVNSKDLAVNQIIFTLNKDRNSKYEIL